MDKSLKVLRELESLSEKEGLPSIGPVKRRVLEGVMGEHKPGRILEVGTLFGYSAIAMARLLPDDGKVTTMEMDQKSAQIARTNIGRAGLSKKVEVILGDALEAIPKLKGKKFDMVFLDATKEEYLGYLKLAEKNLKIGGVVVADNAGIFEREMRDYLEYVRKSGNYRSRTAKVRLEFSDVLDAMEISVRVK